MGEDVRNDPSIVKLDAGKSAQQRHFEKESRRYYKDTTFSPGKGDKRRPSDMENWGKGYARIKW